MESYRSGHNGAVLKTVRAQAHRGSNPLLSAKNSTPKGVLFFYEFNLIRTGAVVNGLPVAVQSRDLASSAEEVESLALRQKQHTERCAVFLYFEHNIA